MFNVCGSINLNQTMTSLDIAQLCGKRHNNVVRDLKALEKQSLLQLLPFEELQTYTIGNRKGKKERTIYNLPFKETMTLVSGYNAKLRMSIINRWVGLESQQNTEIASEVKHNCSIIKDKIKVAQTILTLTRRLGFTGNEALLSADKASRRAVGFSPLKLLDKQQLVSEVQAIAFTPTELGRVINKSAQEVNNLLQLFGLQEKVAGKWHPTDQGGEFSVILDTNKKHLNGVSVKQVKWYKVVIKQIV